MLKDYFLFNINQNNVIVLLSELFEDYNYPNSVVIRSDNGSQFIARKVPEYLGLIGVQQEFTHIATPEENAHIEAYHGILKKEVFKRFDYQYFGEIEHILKRYVKFYNNNNNNNRRLHGLLGRITPIEKWNADKHLNYDEKINCLINNRNLKNYSCSIGVKTPLIIDHWQITFTKISLVCSFNEI
jgi:putative transposase